MQVKKYEAKTMREALLMIKSELGPEAVILSAKNNAKRYGLSGENSVEVTAAVSEESLRKKNFAVKKLNNDKQKVFQDYGAKEQKVFIEQAIENKRRKVVEDVQPVAEVTAVPYIHIQDEAPVYGRSQIQATTQVPTVATQTNVDGRLIASQMAPGNTYSEQKVTSVLSNAKKAFGELSEEEKSIQQNALVPVASTLATYDTNGDQREEEIGRLKQEVESLKLIINKFNQVPQSFVSLHPGAHEGVPFELSFMFEKLKKTGVNSNNALEIIKHIQEGLPKDKQLKKPYVDAFVAQFILKNTDVVTDPFAGKYHVFYGSAGEGKTTTLVKFASELSVRKRKNIAVLTTDTKKVGSVDQLKVYCQILNVPFAVIRRPSDWDIVKDKFSQYDHILVDTPDINFKNIVNDPESVENLPPSDFLPRNHFVQSMLSKDERAFEKVNHYKKLNLADVIFTKLDETSEHGLIYNFQKQFNLPIHSFSIGDSIPEDYEFATKERVVDLLFKLTKMTNKKGI